MVMLFIFPLYADPASDLELTKTERAWIKNHPVVTVANELDWPPFDYVENDKPAGYSIDVARLIAKKAGLKLAFVNGYTWQELLQQFKESKIDIMPAIYVNKERSKYISFTRPYFSQPSVMVVHKDNKDIHDISSLTGKRVAGIRGFVITTTLNKLVPDITIEPVANIIEGLKAVSLGKADAFVDSIGTVSYNLEHNYIPNLKIIEKINNDALANPALHFGVAKDKQVLRNILDKALASISRKEKQTLEKRWIYIPEFIQKENSSKRIILTPEQKEWLAEHPVIRIGIDAGYAPYSFLDSKGTFVGVAPDFINLIGEKLGVSFEALPGLTWPQIVKGAREHTLDVIATAVITEERKSFLNFTQIYIPTPLVIMSHMDDHLIRKASDLDGLTVALVEGYSSSKRVMDEHPSAKIIKVNTPIEGLHAVSNGKANAYVGVLGVNIYQTQNQGITNLKVAANYDVVSNGQRFAVRSDWSELTQILERALISITEEERKAIYNKWINVPYVEQVDYSLLWKILVVFMVILGLMYIHNRRLAREIIKRETAERNLLEVNEHLVKARKEADKANLAKSDFLSCMSHELRTPLTAVLGYSELIEVGSQEKRTRKNAKAIRVAGHHLLELINDVLDLATIEAGKIALSIQEFRLNQIISECISLTSPLAKKHSISVTENITSISDYQILADHARFRQIILNLLSNAIKYNKEKGSIVLECEVLSSGQLRISISDTGKGLTKEQQQQLFKPFERVGAEKTQIEGTGIGLVICKRLVEAMNGTIGFNSKLGTGSVFWVDMPVIE